MKRIDRRIWNQEIYKFKSQGGLFDLIDNQIKFTYRVTDEEYNFLCKALSDEELDLFTRITLTYTEKKEILTILKNKIYGNNL